MLVPAKADEAYGEDEGDKLLGGGTKGMLFL